MQGKIVCRGEDQGLNPAGVARSPVTYRQRSALRVWQWLVQHIAAMRNQLDLNVALKAPNECSFGRIIRLAPFAAFQAFDWVLPRNTIPPSISFYKGLGGEWRTAERAFDRGLPKRADAD
ncbi:hypothetical protein [Qingshengfaniella alkalisoli]|uniref:Uncharacterized protein n=1 Tax=Qingshengfaniella alkalisoli TaxID=2599296 RepID=A0A5B8I8R1_9RHOB|nr:hypothetical protein [Qingshengfaniella alkalisoli]QDY69146.1 hypothetical protein FPZ52_05530 [Qingshengfaniella alkalisoli]